MFTNFTSKLQGIAMWRKSTPKLYKNNCTIFWVTAFHHSFRSKLFLDRYYTSTVCQASCAVTDVPTRSSATFVAKSHKQISAAPICTVCCITWSQARRIIFSDKLGTAARKCIQVEKARPLSRSYLLRFSSKSWISVTHFVGKPSGCCCAPLHNVLHQCNCSWNVHVLRQEEEVSHEFFTPFPKIRQVPSHDTLGTCFVRHTAQTTRREAKSCSPYGGLWV